MLTKTSSHFGHSAIPVVGLAPGFLAAILTGAQESAQVARLRADVMLPGLLAIQRLGSQSTFTRFFQGLTNAGKTLAKQRVARSNRAGRANVAAGGRAGFHLRRPALLCPHAEA